MTDKVSFDCGCYISLSSNLEVTCTDHFLEKLDEGEA